MRLQLLADSRWSTPPSSNTAHSALCITRAHYNSALVLPSISCFTLMTDRKNQDDVLHFLQAVEGQVPAATDDLLRSMVHLSRFDLN